MDQCSSFAISCEISELWGPWFLVASFGCHHHLGSFDSLGRLKIELANFDVCITSDPKFFAWGAALICVDQVSRGNEFLCFTLLLNQLGSLKTFRLLLRTDLDNYIAA